MAIPLNFGAKNRQSWRVQGISGGLTDRKYDVPFPIYMLHLCAANNKVNFFYKRHTIVIVYCI